MIDKAHCMMNMEDEEEYVDYYDFSRIYRNHPLLIKEDKTKAHEAPEVEVKAIEAPKDPAAEKEDKVDADAGKEEEVNDAGSSWKDCDVESMLSSEAAEVVKDLVSEST